MTSAPSSRSSAEEELGNWEQMYAAFRKATPSSPIWYQLADICIGTLLADKIASLKNKAHDSPRGMTREQMIAGLKAGRKLITDRKDAPELPELLAMEREGLVESELIEFDEQSSAIRFRWKT